MTRQLSLIIHILYFSNEKELNIPNLNQLESYLIYLIKLNSFLLMINL